MSADESTNEIEDFDGFVRRLPLRLLFAAWLIFAVAVTLGLPLFQRHSVHYETTDHSSRSADLSWPSVLFNAMFGIAALFMPIEEWSSKKLLSALDARVYYGSFAVFFLTPMYFLVRRRLQLARWWIIPTSSTLGFAFSGWNSFDHLGTTGIARNYKGIGFFAMVVVFLLMVVAVWLNEWQLKKRPS